MATDNHREWIKPFLSRLAPVFREILLMSFFVNTLALAVPVFTLQVYDRVVGHAGISTLVGLVIGMGVIVLFDFILRQARSRIMQTVALRVDAVVGRQLYNKFTALPLNVLEARTGNYWQALFRDVDVVRNTLSGASAILICDLPFAIMFFGVIWVIAKPIAWVLMVITPIFLFVTYRAGASTGKASAEERAKTQDRDTLIGEMIHGRTTIKALALEGSMRPIWEERHAENIESAISRGSRTDFFSNLGQSLTMTTTVMMTSVGAVAIVNQDLTMGSLIATNMLAGRLIGPLNQLVGQWRVFSGFKQSVERLGEVFAMQSERQESDVKLDKPTGSMGCAGVTFSYAPGVPPVCDNVTVQFRARGIHALVGRNGSGKTTLLKILQGLYVPSSGRVLLDGADITQFSRAELAQWMGYVPQESTLFAGTVRDNIIHRFPSATDDQIIKAAKAAGVHEFIIDMPDGYGTEIGEAGQRLSGGQRQRIAIARALIGDPAVLLLDEPSSSLDRHAEHELRDTLKDLSKEHTIIIVTHSPILLAACDNLIALDKGKVALAGPATDILPRLFGGGSKEQAVAAAATAGRKKQTSEPVGENKGRRVADKPAAPISTGDTAEKKPLAAPKLGGAAPSAKPAPAASGAKHEKPDAGQRPKAGVKPVAKRPAPARPAPGGNPEAKPGGEGKPVEKPAPQQPFAHQTAPQRPPAAPPQAPAPAQQKAPPPQAPKAPTQGAQQPAQTPPLKPDTPAAPDDSQKRPTAQASPPPGAKPEGDAGNEDDPYSAALRDMIRSDH
ncbi:MAG: ATP-binding cassette domain-containing protein [Rhodospirillales bacterium]